jgi:hypothetical protein
MLTRVRAQPIETVSETAIRIISLFMMPSWLFWFTPLVPNLNGESKKARDMELMGFGGKSGCI